MHSYWVDETLLLTKDELNDLYNYRVFEGNSADKIASLTVVDDFIHLQCDKYTLSITNDNIVYANCKGEIYNTLTASILKNEYLERYIVVELSLNPIPSGLELISILRTNMNEKIASIILNVLMFDMNLFTILTH